MFSGISKQPEAEKRVSARKLFFFQKVHFFNNKFDSINRKYAESSTLSLKALTSPFLRFVLNLK